MNIPPTYQSHRYLSEARHVVVYLVKALQDCNKKPAFREFVLTETKHEAAVILFAVLDELKLGGPIAGYFAPDVLHQISTLTKGKRVAYSNHNGARYAILLSRPLSLPQRVAFPPSFGLDEFPLGQGRRGPISLSAERLLNVLITGASRSGKSNFLSSLAYAALAHGYQLYLADPQEITFSAAWSGLCAAPVAASKADFVRLLEAVRQELWTRGEQFKSVARPGGLPVQKIEEYNRVAGVPMPRAFVIVDEANTYMDQKTVVEAVADIARQSLKYGVHVVLAGHSWRAQDVPRGLSASFATRVAFRVNDDTSAAVVLDSDDWGRRAMKFERPGRGVVRYDGGALQEVQAYYLPEESIARLLAGHSLPPRSALDDEQQRLVALALDESRPLADRGRMSETDLVGWGLKSYRARALGVEWEYKGWLVKGANRARFVSALLREITGSSV
jgi:hypothetical protein